MKDHCDKHQQAVVFPPRPPCGVCNPVRRNVMLSDNAPPKGKSLMEDCIRDKKRQDERANKVAQREEKQKKTGKGKG